MASVETPKEHINIVLIGHVDAGKSTTGGQILLSSGQYDRRTFDKYRQEAKEKNHESWWLSWAFDTNAEEREKGKTIEVGRASFTTDHKKITILDAPGHKGFVPNMICGAAQADIAILVISARKGEFETGFERGGQTREHAMLAKTAGVRYLAVLINKMDDPTVEWSEERFNECRDKLMPFLRRICGFKEQEITFIPASSQTGAYIKDPEPSLCPWYSGPTLIDYLDALPPINQVSKNTDFIMPVTGKYKDMGTVVTGKVESGQVTVGAKLLCMPNRVPVEAVSLYIEEDEVEKLQCGDNGRIKLKGVEEDDIYTGMVLCDQSKACKVARVFDAQIYVIEHPRIICPGYSAVMHIHAATEEVKMTHIIALLDRKTGEKTKTRFIKQDQLALVRLECQGRSICMDKFTEFDGRLGRFTLRDEGKSVAMGKILAFRAE
ncbi:Eukaryotic peptide chain release factor GTP-binding subunit ERF3B [Fragariocoptes setiger]|uniref:Eukaryotic peptide chain release factor GTP-binding subunit ERF3B n=1 Tax=Fragariocoptes setiger TaxID=1670756 RepID=A0ABQ7SAN4_9ACAR|nr:Eukaryotic peptide chain release factor GTP-binding subunit ERF3B [Fragariocoptes setiger]